jgi:hypothetical protein
MLPLPMAIAKFLPTGEALMQALLFPPADPAQRDTWRSQLHQWRTITRDLMGYDSSSYALPAFAWASRTFALGFLMMFDLQFYDPTTGQYRIDEALDEAETNFGGFDALLLWHAYPKIGFDARNQFDFYRDAIGGLDGLRTLVERCHARGVRVYIDYNTWDHATRPESQPDRGSPSSNPKQSSEHKKLGEAIRD